MHGSKSVSRAPFMDTVPDRVHEIQAMMLRAALPFFLAPAVAAPPFRFSNTHGDHMDLQQAPAKAQLWGFGTAGQSVSVVTTAVLRPPLRLAP